MRERPEGWARAAQRCANDKGKRHDAVSEIRGLGACDRTVNVTQLACCDRYFSIATNWFSDHNMKKKKKNDPRKLGRHITCYNWKY